MDMNSIHRINRLAVTSNRKKTWKTVEKTWKYMEKPWGNKKTMENRQRQRNRRNRTSSSPETSNHVEPLRWCGWTVHPWAIKFHCSFLMKSL